MVCAGSRTTINVIRKGNPLRHYQLTLKVESGVLIKHHPAEQISTLTDIELDIFRNNSPIQRHSIVSGGLDSRLA